jgi:transposase
LDIGERHFSLTRKHQAIEAEAALGGIDIIRTNVPAEPMEAAECVRNYKVLANVERAFRSLETTDLKVRPIYHCTSDRERAPLFLCVLAYYVKWHLREICRPEPRATRWRRRNVPRWPWTRSTTAGSTTGRRCSASRP